MKKLINILVSCGAILPLNAVFDSFLLAMISQGFQLPVAVLRFRSDFAAQLPKIGVTDNDML